MERTPRAEPLPLTTTWQASARLDPSASSLPEGVSPFHVRSMGLTRPAYAPMSGRSPSAARPAAARSSARSSARRPKSARDSPFATGRSGASEEELKRFAEDEELADLQDLFSGQRESPVAAGMFARYQWSQDNLAKAMQARAERSARDEEREEMRIQQYEETQDRRNRMRGRNAAVKNELIARNLEGGNMGRQEREDNNRFIEERKQQWHEELRERLEIAAGGFGNINERLAAQEAEADRMEREESSREKQARMDHINSFRKMTAEKNKEAADTLRETTERGMHSALSNSHRRKYLDAEDKRAGSRSAQELFAERERERKAKTAEAKARVLAIRENAARARAAPTGGARRRRCLTRRRAS